jgi:hypothetical protein
MEISITVFPDLHAASMSMEGIQFYVLRTNLRYTIRWMQCVLWY